MRYTHSIHFNSSFIIELYMKSQKPVKPSYIAQICNETKFRKKSWGRLSGTLSWGDDVLNQWTIWTAVYVVVGFAF